MNFLQEVDTNYLAKRIHSFWSKVEVGDGCWEWTGYRNADGYGSSSYRVRYREHKSVASHRLSYFFTNEAWPRLIMHLCDNPACVRPSHLKAATQLENIRHCIAKGRRANWRKEFCKRGHPMNENTVWITSPDGRGRTRRICKECQLQKQREYRSMKRRKQI